MRSRCVNETNNNRFISVIVVFSLKLPLHYHFIAHKNKKTTTARPATTRSHWRCQVSKGKSTKDAAEGGRVDDNDIKCMHGSMRSYMLPISQSNHYLLQCTEIWASERLREHQQRNWDGELYPMKRVCQVRGWGMCVWVWESDPN